MNKALLLLGLLCVVISGCSHTAPSMWGDVPAPVIIAKSPHAAGLQPPSPETEQSASLVVDRLPLGSQVDTDMDGVFDNHDQCPATPNNVAVDAFGCPVSLYMKMSVTYASNQVTPNEAMLTNLERMGSILQQNPLSLLVITGHTDDVGDADANQRLSMTRAQNVKLFLEQHYGITPDRIKAIGYGESHPLVSNATENGRNRNRRVELAVKGYYRSETSYIALHRPYQIHFDTAQTTIGGTFKVKVDDLGAYLNEHPDTIALIDGHTDNSGSADNNLLISQQRADAVKKYLEDKYSIEAERLKALGHGQNQPLVSNDTELGRFKNRRVTITVRRDYHHTAASRFNSRLSLKGRVGTTSYAPLDQCVSIIFKANNHELDTPSKQQINELGLLLQKKADLTITIEGHASCGNTHDHNMRLSQMRAENVKRYLQLRYDINPKRLHVIGYGPDLPVADAGSTENVQIKINKF